MTLPSDLRDALRVTSGSHTTSGFSLFGVCDRGTAPALSETLSWGPECGGVGDGVGDGAGDGISTG